MIMIKAQKHRGDIYVVNARSENTPIDPFKKFSPRKERRAVFRPGKIGDMNWLMAIEHIKAQINWPQVQGRSPITQEFLISSVVEKPGKAPERS